LSIQPADSVPAGSVTASRVTVLLPALHPPAPRYGAVVRRALLDRLNGEMSAKLVLVAAPAGWGKTSLLRDWCASGDAHRTAWLSLDRGDNDLGRFWSGVIAALRTVYPAVGADTLHVLMAPGDKSADSALPTLINDLARVPKRFTLVIDDLHLITSEVIREWFRFLVDHLPPTLGLIAATRVDPALPLARMRARGELAELRADDLRFSEAETAQLLNGTLGLALPPVEIQALHQRIEGWAAGLYLAGLSLRGRKDPAQLIGGITGDSRQIVDYFAAEVLDEQAPRIRSFLLRTSVLDRFSGPLCDAVTGATGSQELLQELEGSQLFLVPLDTTRRWYRYHTLFAELLRHELDQSKPGLAQLLHRRASAWHRQHGSVIAAIDHAFSAGDLADVRELLVSNWQRLLSEGLIETVDSWLNRLPPRMVTEDSRLCLIRAWLACFLGRVDEVEPWLTAVEAAAPAGPFRGGPVTVESAAAMLRAQSCHMQGDLAMAESASRHALALEEKGSPRWRAAALALVGVSLFWRGRDAEALPYLERVADPTRPPDSNLASVWAVGCLAAIAAREGDLESCEHRLRQASLLAVDHDLGSYWMTATAVTTSAELLAGSGELAEAGEAARHALVLARRGRSRPEAAHALLCLARLSLRAGDLDEARARTREARDIVTGCADPGILGGLLAQAETAAGPPSPTLGLQPGSRGRDRQPDGLTARETEVLGLLAAGHTNSEIAAQLVLSVYTVERHLQNAYRKIGARNRADATAYVVRRTSLWRATGTSLAGRLVPPRVQDGGLPGCRDARTHGKPVACVQHCRQRSLDENLRWLSVFGAGRPR
jgi:LuxR family transcriptional regulator, maltose regulon positive regulatory protein